MAIVDTTSEYLRSASETSSVQPAEHLESTTSTPVHVADAGTVTSTHTPATSSSASASSRAFGGPEIPTTAQAMGQHTVEAMNKANNVPGAGGQYDLTHGIHYSYNYKKETKKAGQEALWKDEYRSGYNASGMFLNPQETGAFMDFQLKPGQSASKAIKAWLGGLTVAECLTTVFAMEYESVRATLGDTKFDSVFGSADAKIDQTVTAASRRLRIAPNSETPISEFLKSTELAKISNDGKHPDGVSSKELDDHLIPGHWYYFYNHPKYLLKHPGGAWQGENALYMGRKPNGERLWAGLGASGMTEDTMIDEMVSAYNGARNEEDELAMKRDQIKNADGSYANSIYDPTKGVFNDTVTKKEILTDPSFKIGEDSRKGGFLANAGTEVDVAKVKAIK
jgi:Protein-glutamine gamma-glutamyltransferase